MNRTPLLVLVWLAVLAVGMVMCSDGASGHHSCRYFLENTVKPRESNGEYDAVNERPSEYHPSSGETGSYGAYQIAQFLWDETAQQMADEGLRNWVGVRPSFAPKIVQDHVALLICERYGRCPWLFPPEREACFRR